MATDERDDSYRVMAIVCWAVALCFMVPLTVWVIRLVYIKEQEEEKSSGVSTGAVAASGHQQPLMKLSWIFTIAALLSWCFCGLFKIISEIEGLAHANVDASHCDELAVASGAMILFGKGMMLLVMTLRLEIAFGGSSLAYPKCFLRTLLFVWATYSIVQPITFGAFTKINHTNQCIVEWPIESILAGIFTDVVGSILMMVLFVVPLCKMSKDNSRKRHVVSLAYKYTLLTCIAGITTILMLLFVVALRLDFLAAIDIVANTYALAMFSHELDDFYLKLCGCCVPEKYQSVKEDQQRELESRTQPQDEENAGDAVAGDDDDVPQGI